MEHVDKARAILNQASMMAYEAYDVTSLLIPLGTGMK